MLAYDNDWQCLRQVLMVVLLFQLHNSIRTRHHLHRPAIVSPSDSPWQRLYEQADPSSFLHMTGLSAYVTRINLYNLIFWMVILLVPFLTQPPHERTLTGRGSRVYPNVGAAGCTLKSGQPGAAWSGQEVCSGFALAACCMNSYYTIRIKECINWYKNHTVYEFVLYNLYNNCMNSFV